jgi:hypothetical protein
VKTSAVTVDRPIHLSRESLVAWHSTFHNHHYRRLLLKLTLSKLKSSEPIHLVCIIVFFHLCLGLSSILVSFAQIFQLQFCMYFLFPPYLLHVCSN